MELPPYHRPRLGALLKSVLIRMLEVLRKSFVVIIGIAILFWAATWSSGGDIHETALYRFGAFIEPVTMLFGLRWQTFVAYVASAIGKEAALGVFASVFGAARESVNIFNVTMGTASVSTGTLSAALLAGITKPEALAFLFAFFFNIPCFMTISTTYQETHSVKWTLLIIVYYIGVSLLLAGVAYRVGLAIF
jgi:ferrous iron transport protein B